MISEIGTTSFSSFTRKILERSHYRNGAHTLIRIKSQDRVQRRFLAPAGPDRNFRARAAGMREVPGGSGGYGIPTSGQERSSPEIFQIWEPSDPI